MTATAPTLLAPVQGTPEWLEWRLGGYGASEVPILVAGDQEAWWRLHARKLRLIDGDLEMSAPMAWGLKLEDTIAEAYTEEHPEHPEVVRVNRPLVHPDRPHVRASLDRKRRRGRVVVELKSWAFPTDDFGPSGTDQIPDNWIDQVQQQLAVTGYDHVDLAVLFTGPREFRWYQLGRDQTRIDALLELEDNAWAFVARGEMPPWPGPAPTRLRIRDGELEADAALDDLIARGHQARLNKQQAEKADKELTTEILERVGDYVVARGSSIDITAKPNRDGELVAWELIAKAHRKSLELVLERLNSAAFHGLADIPDLDAIESTFTTTKAGARPLRYVPHKEASHDDD